MEELWKARLKHQDLTHFLFVGPRLMTPYWQKQLHKVADFFDLPCGILPEWDASHRDPLVVGIVFYFVPHRPWQLQNIPML